MEYTHYISYNKDLEDLLKRYPVLYKPLWNLITDGYTSYEHAVRAIDIMERMTWLFIDIPINTVTTADFDIRSAYYK
jgi:hypothetical protein